MALRVDPDGLRQAATSAANAPAEAGSAAVVPAPPCAADPVSVAAAGKFAARIGALNLHASLANAQTIIASLQVGGSAGVYEIQNEMNRIVLSSPGASAALAATAPAGVPSAPSAPGADLFGDVPIPPAGAPLRGKEIATLIHSGPGPAAMEATAQQLDMVALQLATAADYVAAARRIATDNWESDAADRADRRLSALQATYRRQSSQAQGISKDITTHTAAFKRAQTTVPRPEVIASKEQKLMRLAQANAHPSSLGRYTIPVAEATRDLAGSEMAAQQGYGAYFFAGAPKVGKPGGDEETPRPKTDDGRRPAQWITGGEGSPGDPEPRANPFEPREQAHPMTLPDGTPVDTDDFGPGAPETPGVPSTGDDPFGLNPSGDPLQELGLGGDDPMSVMTSLIPAVLSGITGGLGAVTGVVGGLGSQVQEAGSQAAGALSQALTSAVAAPELDTSDLNDPGFSDVGGGGGGFPGGTEPASSPTGLGQLTAPTGVASAAVSAAPAVSTAAVGTPAPGVGGMPMGGGMMPPMMPGMTGGAGGGDENRFREDRRLKMEPAANSEPVKNRREQRPRSAEGRNDGEGDSAVSGGQRR